MKKLSEQRERALAKAVQAIMKPEQGAAVVLFPRGEGALGPARAVDIIGFAKGADRPTEGEFLTGLMQAAAQFVGGDVPPDFTPQDVAGRANALGLLCAMQLNRELTAAGRGYGVPQALIIPALAAAMLRVAPVALIADFLEQLAAGLRTGAAAPSEEYQAAWEALENAGARFIEQAMANADVHAASGGGHA